MRRNGVVTFGDVAIDQFTKAIDRFETRCYSGTPMRLGGSATGVKLDAPRKPYDQEGYADQSERRDHRPGIIDRRNQTGPFEQRLDDGLHRRVGQDGGPDR
jgi:hypothetical protein